MQTKNAEKPILFSTPMVRAILDGRKTQTRRPVKGARGAFWDHGAWTPRVAEGAIDHWALADGRTFSAGAHRPRCPYGSPGNLLWVRETHHVEAAGQPSGEGRRVLYRADDEDAPVSRWTPSIHMPRWASRITLRVTDVRVERIQDISESDARAEGFEAHGGQCSGPMDPAEFDGTTAAHELAALWDEINAKRGYGWDANPWVWVVEFERVTASREEKP